MAFSVTLQFLFMIVFRLAIFFILTLTAQIAFCQQDSLVSYAKRINLGMRTVEVDSLMPFSLANMHKASGGTWRYIYNDIYQSSTTYEDKDWNGYTFRMIYNNDKLIYFDLITNL